ncbi:gamma-mobile-trio recombinase GmtY [Pseudomonas sp.]|jgi:hypothetical protein|uniref:gamma-mobile-trio recombinase GmtY n=1 Tax=Pseudomonas sp. TaxID=306 RepID=UPI002ED7B7A3
MFVTVKAKVLSDATGIFTEMPVLLTPAGVLTPLLDYCLARAHDRSLAWMIKLNKSVRLFLEYMECNHGEEEGYVLFRNFAQRLYTGTFEKQSGLDESGLCWRGRSPLGAQNIITQLTDFFRWLGELRPAAATLNPKYVGSVYDQKMDRYAYEYRRNSAFLGHAWESNASNHSSGRLRPRRPLNVEIGDPPAFPEDRFMDLLVDGFKVGGRYDYRNMLITLLLHGAGFRESEPFHLYISDVIRSPEDSRYATVSIHHPTYGAAPEEWVSISGKAKLNRSDYLAARYSCAPRNELLNSKGAGWKGGMHDAPYYKKAYWFSPNFGQLFQTLWERYLEQVAGISRSHPFAFVNIHREPRGEMYCIAQYNKSHAAACRRIGLIVSKSCGTTPHGHRHAYGRRLSEAGINKDLIRRFMHHSSIDSQDIYTRIGMKEALEALTVAADRMYPNLSIDTDF